MCIIEFMEFILQIILFSIIKLIVNFPENAIIIVCIYFICFMNIVGEFSSSGHDENNVNFCIQVGLSKNNRKWNKYESSWYIYHEYFID